MRGVEERSNGMDRPFVRPARNGRHGIQLLRMLRPCMAARARGKYCTYIGLRYATAKFTATPSLRHVLLTCLLVVR
jgi:hypothetical protein